MTDFRKCKQCGFHLLPKERPEDQAAIMHGFCTNVCRQIYAQDKQIALDHANDPNPIREAGL